MKDNIIDFGKEKLKREREKYELELDTELITTRRQIEDIAINIVMDFAHLWDIEQIIAKRIMEKGEQDERL